MHHLPPLLSLLLYTCVLAPLAAQPDDGAAHWLRYPAVSPDGQTIVFSYQGDLYRVASTGGDAQPLTIGADYANRPVFSPDGKTIAFASDRHGNFDVFVMPATGGPARRLTHHSGGDRPYGFTADGRHLLVGAVYQDPAASLLFPSGRQPELYRVAVADGTVSQALPTPAEEVVAHGDYYYYHDQKGYENEWRKHHTSAIARDLWRYNTTTKKYEQLTKHVAEDRNPVVSADGKTVYFLSERKGDFNVFRMPAGGGEAKQVTSFKKHPVRFLSAAKDGLLVFGWHGDIYTLRDGQKPQKLDVRVRFDGRQPQDEVVSVNGGLTEGTLSPSGKEYAYVFRGEVFVSSVETGHTKRLTNTAHQERSLSWHPSGRRLLYAAEVGQSWDLLETSIKNEDEPYFFTATELTTKPVVATPAEEFQAAYSPDGKKIAYVKDRTTIMVHDSATNARTMVLGPEHNYSYADGDMNYAWSPDSRYLVADFGPPERVAFFTDIALVDVTKTNEPVNITRGGYSEIGGQFAPDGSQVFFYSVREGGTEENGWPAGDGDVYTVYLNREARDLATLSKEDFALYEEMKKKQEKAEKKDEEKKKDEVEPLKIEFDGLDERSKRLTRHTDAYQGFTMDKDASKLFLLRSSDGKTDLYQRDLREGSEKVLAKLDAGGVGALELSADGKSLFLIADGKPAVVTIADGKVKRLSPKGEMQLKRAEERQYIFDHAWRQLREKFYVKDIQGVDWDFYREAYRPLLPYVSNNYDFAELLSEMLGETNASHTGSGYRASNPKGDRTAALGLLYTLDGNGLTVTEVIKDGPFDRADSKLTAGARLTSINGEAVRHLGDLHRLLNRQAGDYVRVGFTAGGAEQAETVKPISTGAENELLYHRWVRNQRAQVEKLSDGQLGYVHVRGMNSASMKDVVDASLGRHIGAKGLVVDTRFNGGGNLHDRLSDFLNGKAYLDIIPHGQYIGSQPMNRWNKPSIVLVGESNYSDAHLFPEAYRIKGVGKSVGMPVPGTGTFVWWETQIDPTIYFGIPMGGWRRADGKFLENTQFEPEVKVQNMPAAVTSGTDAQTARAVAELLKEVK